MRFRKKPVVVEAMQWDGTKDAFDRIYEWAMGDLAVWDAPITSDGCYDSGDAVERLCVDTLEGHTYASIGDWIIRGVRGEFYPCKPDIFAATYEECETYTLFIPMRLPSKNEMKRKYRHPHAYRRLRNSMHLAVLSQKLERGIPEAQGKRRVTVTRLIGPRGKLFDYSGIVAGAVPLMDCLTNNKLLLDDSPQWVIEEYAQERAPEHGVRVELEDVE